MTTSNVSLSKNFNPAELTEKHQQNWEKLKLAQPQFQHGSESFCILLPPPNVTGVLHMGHAFNQTIIDALIRYHRMVGDNTLWIPGTDHAGIATQLVVERELEKEKKKKKDIGRETFIQCIWEWKNQSSQAIKSQIKKLGASVDWSREYFTLDEKMSEAVNEAFVRLHKEGLIYRGKRLVNWDPELQSAISDLEVTAEEQDGKMYYLQYPIKNSNESITVATTRPETIFGDVAVMVHPDDNRYHSLIGKKVILPISHREIEIISDISVDPQFGTGAVKVTPAHDFDDYQVALRHALPMVEIFTLDGHLNDTVPPLFRGLTREKARHAIIEDCHKKNILVKIQPHKLMIPKNERSGTIIEPMLTDQWFIAVNKPVKGKDGSMKSMAERASNAITDREIVFFPENWVNTYEQWLNNIQDWCISRQLWWGHRIPAWHGENGQIFVATDQDSAYLEAKKAGYTGILRQDEDVLDTWFSSSLTPFSALGWPRETEDLKHFLPSAVLVTGFDILFFWVARMIMLTKHFMGKVPFHKVYIHGLVRDASGQKMSKSKGNVLDPIDIIDGIEIEALIKKRTSHLLNPKQAEKIEHETRKQFPNGIKSMGIDALRFTFASIATMGRNISFDLARTEGYSNFCNKLWNATRFVSMSCTKEEDQVNDNNHKKFRNPNNYGEQNQGWSLIPPAKLNTSSLTTADRWIITRFNIITKEAHHYFQSLRIDLIAQILYQFVWEEFCDWYLEMAKIQFSNTFEQKNRTQDVLLYILDGILRLLHPLMPFITESLWQHIHQITTQRSNTELLPEKKKPSLMVQSYPVSNPNLIDEKSQIWLKTFKEIVISCRNLRSQLKLSPAQRVPLYLIDIKNTDSAYIKEILPYLLAFAKLSDIKIFDNEKEFDKETNDMPVAIALPFKLALFISIDPQEEIERTNKELIELKIEIEKLNFKLNNQQFLSKAPGHIVEKEKDRMLELDSKEEKLLVRLRQLDLLKVI